MNHEPRRKSALVFALGISPWLATYFLPQGVSEILILKLLFLTIACSLASASIWVGYRFHIRGSWLAIVGMGLGALYLMMLALVAVGVSIMFGAR